MFYLKLFKSIIFPNLIRKIPIINIIKIYNIMLKLLNFKYFKQYIHKIRKNLYLFQYIRIMYLFIFKLKNLPQLTLTSSLYKFFSSIF